METFTRDNFGTISLMVKVFSNILMGMYIKEASQRIKNMGKAFIYMQIKINMKDLILRIKDMDLENFME